MGTAESNRHVIVQTDYLQNQKFPFCRLSGCQPLPQCPSAIYYFQGWIYRGEDRIWTCTIGVYCSVFHSLIIPSGFQQQLRFWSRTILVVICLNSNCSFKKLHPIAQPIYKGFTLASTNSATSPFITYIKYLKIFQIPYTLQKKQHWKN